MPASEADLMARLSELGIKTVTHRHAPMFTVEESRALRGDLPGGHCKTLFLRDKKRNLWLIVALEDRVIDLKALNKAIGANRLSFGNADLLLDVLGVTPGAVTPFALINDVDARVQVVLDKGMLEFDPLNYHPLHNEATTAIAPDDLVRFVRATGFEPQIIDLETLG
jgi:Ala-tRNA(Pro) deacylase